MAEDQDQDQAHSKYSLECDNTFKFYQKHYFYELDLEEKLYSRTQTLFVILSSLNLFIYYIFSHIKTHEITTYYLLCCLFLTIAFVLNIYAIIYYYKCVIPSNELVFSAPTMLDIEEYRNKLIEYKPYDYKIVRRHFTQFILNTYIAIATNTADRNLERKVYFSNTLQYLGLAFVSAFLSTIFLYFGNLNYEKSKCVKVIVTNPIKVEGEIENARQIRTAIKSSTFTPLVKAGKGGHKSHSTRGY